MCINNTRPQLTDLRCLSGQGNVSIPLDLAVLTDLETFQVSYFNIVGGLEVFQALPSLKEIDLAENGLEGSIEQILDSLVSNKTKSVSLGGNPGLTGEVPWESIGELSALHLPRTGVSIGHVPSGLESYSLEVFDFSSNLLDEFPVDLFRFRKMAKLDLSHSQMKGTIPEDIRHWNATLTSLVLDSNSLEGSIPLAFDYLTALGKILLVYKHGCISFIPHRDPSILTPTEILKIQGNQLTGTISDAICRERGLRKNQLSSLLVDCRLVFCFCCDGEGC